MADGTAKKRGPEENSCTGEKMCFKNDGELFIVLIKTGSDSWTLSSFHNLFFKCATCKTKQKKHSGLCNKIVTSNEFLIYICECICLCWSMAIKEMPVPITQKTLFTEFHKILAYLMLRIGLMNRVDLFFCKTFVNVCLNFYSHFFLNRLCALIDCSPIVNSNCLQSFTNVICVRFVDVYL